MHGAAPHGDVDVVVGHDAGESFGNAAELYGIRTGRFDGALSSREKSGGQVGAVVANVSRGSNSTRVALSDP
jgi:hypothetical protein